MSLPTTMRFAFYFFSYFLLLRQCDGKIIRVGDKFLGRFVLVDSDLRMKANCIRNITTSTTPKECCHECLSEKKCQSFNRHRVKGVCELLAISKCNESGLLRRDVYWVHYETDDDEQNVRRSFLIFSHPEDPFLIRINFPPGDLSRSHWGGFHRGT